MRVLWSTRLAVRICLIGAAEWRAQSVDLDHPRCFDFLKEDLTHVNDFFSRKGASMHVRCKMRVRLSRR